MREIPNFKVREKEMKERVCSLMRNNYNAFNLFTYHYLTSHYSVLSSNAFLIGKKYLRR